MIHLTFSSIIIHRQTFSNFRKTFVQHSYVEEITIGFHFKKNEINLYDPSDYTANFRV